MTSVYNSIYNWTGWHTVETARQECIPEEEHAAKKYNIFLTLGYLPVVGGLMALVHLLNAPDESKLSTRVYLIVRGVFEILGLGVLFLIPDIAVSIHRHCITKAPQPTVT